MNILFRVLAVIAILFLVGCGTTGGASSGGGGGPAASVSSDGGLTDEQLVKMGIKETYGLR
ncbi:MAG: hypothetical protein IH802_10735 [Nitrospinae bacterium]|nr:hypothetical protein [Nitrospinota bacterium]